LSKPSILINLLRWLSQKSNGQQAVMIHDYFENPNKLSYEDNAQMGQLVTELKFRLVTSTKDLLRAEILKAGIDERNASKLVERSMRTPSFRAEDIRQISRMSKRSFERTVVKTIEFFMTREFGNGMPEGVHPSQDERMAVYRVLYYMIDAMISVTVTDDQLRKVLARGSLSEERIDFVCSRVKQNLTPIRHVLSFHMLHGVSTSNNVINERLDELSEAVNQLNVKLDDLAKERRKTTS
jgi:tetrahydromethanopterin S-methyltransferase subunit G